MAGTIRMKKVFSQLTCLYQLPQVMGWVELLRVSVLSLRRRRRRHGVHMGLLVIVGLVGTRGNVIGGSVGEVGSLLGLAGRGRGRRHVEEESQSASETSCLLQKS